MVLNLFWHNSACDSYTYKTDVGRHQEETEFLSSLKMLSVKDRKMIKQKYN